MYIYICIYVYIYIYVLYLYICPYICISISVSKSISRAISEHFTHTHTYIYIYIYMHTHTRICVYIYIYTSSVDEFSILKIHQTSDLFRKRWRWAKKRGVELGAGLGLPAIVAARLGAEVVATAPWHWVYIYIYIYVNIHIHDTHIIYTRRDGNCLFIKTCVLHGTYILGSCHLLTFQIFTQVPALSGSWTKDGDACVMKLLRRNVKDNGGARLSLGIHYKRALQREMVWYNIHQYTKKTGRRLVGRCWYPLVI